MILEEGKESSRHYDEVISSTELQKNENNLQKTTT